MSAHAPERLALEAAQVLGPEERAALEAHLGQCPACAAELAEWRRLADGLGQLPASRVSRGLAQRTAELVERRLAERADRAWNRAALAFAIALSWTLALVAWMLLDVLLGGLASRLQRPLGPTVVWYGAYLVFGWLTAGAAAVLLGRRAGMEGRTI